jgi:hypothetical protein
MDEQLDISRTRIQDVIAEFNGKPFFTADVIRKYSGGFFSNKGVPAIYSLNAQFGQLLQRNHDFFGIRQMADNIGILDDLGHKTTSSKWCVVQKTDIRVSLLLT